MKGIIFIIFLFVVKIKYLYSCEDIEVHKKIIEHVLEHEGDKVLKTKYEYSKYGVRNTLLKNYNKKYNYNYNIRSLKKDTAREIALDLMREYQVDKIESCDLKLVVYDLFYNAGPRAGTVVSQRAVNRYYNEGQLLDVDGRMGNLTIGMLNSVENLEGFIKVFIEERLNYYSDFKNWETYKNGWTKRINSFFEIKDLDCKSTIGK